MKRLLVLIAIISMTGCASILEKIPSRWDVNQAKVVTDIQQEARRFDCKGDLTVQLNELDKNVEWFDIYAQTKPTRDVAKLSGTLSKTIKEMQERVKAGPISPLYCDLKQKIIKQQADILAGSVQGRF